jgi:hypothetical protein
MARRVLRVLVAIRMIATEARRADAAQVEPSANVVADTARK